MAIDLLYFGAFRDAFGRDGERVDPPGHVVTVADLITWLADRGDPYDAAFADRAGVFAAVEAEPVAPEGNIFGAREVALFPSPGAL
ncbi:MoaD/ThiS family protein [Sphingosinicella sp. BN140058]|uniref:MoaD/ThiS family protein n=1 Tax=Sphingosinicella sp. BN140058 TaxID=1892855 RepID=UPI001010C60E|nr:MoaD/ThiS family protein [Sphingosinicella sp. BN140058]QAY78560.1 molybdopterin synthase sulfur carrier subunit [Sphingosinicella sp. BN140058]